MLFRSQFDTITPDTDITIATTGLRLESSSDTSAMMVSYGKIVDGAFVALPLDEAGNPTSVPLNVQALISNDANIVANTKPVRVENDNIDNDQDQSDVIITSFVNAHTGDASTSEKTLISNTVSAQQ